MFSKTISYLFFFNISTSQCIPAASPFCKGGLRPALARLGGYMSWPDEAVMLDQPLSQRIKARSGPGGIFLIQPGLIETLLFFRLCISIGVG